VPLDKISNLDRVKQPSDPWAFFVRLNRTITANTSSDQLLEDFFTLLHTIPEVEASWYGAADGAGNVRSTMARGSFSERYQVVQTIAEVIHGQNMNGPAARAWRSRQPQYCEDWLTDPSVAVFRESSRGLNWASSAAIPLLGRSGPCGILAIYSNKSGFFPNVWSQDVLAQIGAVLGNALESRQKHASLQRAESLYRTLYQTADLMLKATTETQMLRNLCKTLVDKGLFLSAMIGQVDPDNIYRYKIGASQLLARRLRQESYPYVKGGKDRPTMLDSWETSKTIVTNDYMKFASKAGTFQIAKKINIRSAVTIPIFRGANRWAVLSVTTGKEQFFDKDIVALLEQLASMVGHRLDELDLKAALRAEREAQSQIARLDILTGLPNQLGFDEHLRGSMARAVRHKTIAGVGIIDIDRFNQFNASWGAAAGDIVLKETASRLRKMLREIDFVARIGSDKFALIMEDWSWSHDIEGLCARLHEILNAPIAISKDTSVQITISAGFTLYPMDNGSAKQLLSHAVTALYAARAGRGKFDKFWRLYMDITDGTKDQFAGRALLSRGALKVHYQPVMKLRSGKIVSVEALARLDDGSRLIMPGRFLRDLLLDDRVMLFGQVLETALAQLKSWDAQNIHLNVSVNVDAQILLLDRTLPYIVQQLEQSGIEPRRLVLEILETHDFIDLDRAIVQLKAIRAHGVRIALDDLGAGYSSISKIRELPLDVVKLDRKFIASLAEQPDDLMFISVFQTLTKSLGMDLIVEGVETQDVMEALRLMGAHQAQGYFITKPMSAEQLTVWLQAFQPVEEPTAPKALLGAYAVHLTWLRAFQFTRTQEALLDHLRTHDPFSLKQFLQDHDYLDKPLGQAYLKMQAMLQDSAVDRSEILKASEQFRAELIAALTS